METESSIEDLNARAVALLRAGSFEKAVMLLDQALEHLRSRPCTSSEDSSVMQVTCCESSVATKATCVSLDDSWVPYDDSVCGEGTSGSSIALEPSRQSCCNELVEVNFDEANARRTRMSAVRSVPVSSLAPATAKRFYRSADNIFEFYSRAMVFVSPGEGNCDEVCWEGKTSAVLFNMGLSYHNQAIWLQHQHGLVNLADLHYKYALNLYNMAQLYLHQAWYQMDDERMKLLLGLALSNNCGHVHSQLLNHAETSYSLDAIRHFMHSLPDEASCKESGLTWDDYIFFSRTSVMHEDNNLKIAPTA